MTYGEQRGRVKRRTLQDVLDLETKVRDWVTDNKNNGFFVSSK
jgi:hypothetical protein